MKYFLRLLILAALLAGCGRASTPEPASQSGGIAAAATTAPAPTLAPRPTATLAATAAPSITPALPTEAPTLVPAETPTSAPPATSAPTAAVASLGDSTLSGSVTYPADLGLPADAVLSVQLRLGQRSFLYDKIGAEQVIPLQAGPMPFTYAYAAADIDPNMTYSLVGEVRAGGRLLLSGAVLAIDHGFGGAGVVSPIELPLHPVPTANAVSGSVTYPGGEQPPAAELTVKLTAPVDGVGGPRVLSEQRIAPDQSGRAQFSLPIDPSQIDPYTGYHVFAEFAAPGRLPRWQEASVLTYGNPTSLELAITPHADARTLGGNALLPEGATLPADAVLSVQIASVSNGTIGDVVREHTFAPGGAGPVPFLIEYLPGSFYEGSSYALYASVRQGPKLLFTTPLLPLDPAALPERIDAPLQVPAAIGRVEGTLSYPQGEALPADALLSIQLADMRYVGGDGSPIVVAEQIVAPVGPAPISFAIEYDPLAIDGRIDYAIVAAISGGGQRLFGAYERVISNGHPSQIAIELKSGY